MKMKNVLAFCHCDKTCDNLIFKSLFLFGAGEWTS
jgi:thiamine kinase-like enzyme